MSNFNLDIYHALSCDEAIDIILKDIDNNTNSGTQKKFEMIFLDCEMPLKDGY